MKKTVFKYIGIGVAALVILAFAIYFAFGGGGTAGFGHKDKQDEAQEDIPDDDTLPPGAIREEDMPNVGDVVELPVIELDDSSVTWDAYTFFDDFAGAGDNFFEIYVLHNNTEFDMDLYVDIDYQYASGEQRINSVYIKNLPAGEDTCVWTMPSEYTERDVRFSARRPEDGTFTVSDKLAADYIDDGSGISGTITNNSGYKACYVDAVVLFFDGKQIVCMKPIGICGEDDAMADGESRDFTVPGNGREYNEIQVYLNGYGIE